MPSFLGNYPNAATGRNWKIVRAIDSFFAQNVLNKKLYLIADNCDLTEEHAKEYCRKFDQKIFCPEKKQFEFIMAKNLNENFSGFVRNTGLAISKKTDEGEQSLIAYLDIDDYMMPGHLQAIQTAFENYPDLDWVYFDDKVAMSADLSQSRNREAVIQFGRIGTSNIAHRTHLDITWGNGYGHDWNFINELMEKYPNYAKIKTPGIMVCHIPQQIDF